MLDSVRSSIIAATFRVSDRSNAKPNPDASSRDGSCNTVLSGNSRVRSDVKRYGSMRRLALLKSAAVWFVTSRTPATVGRLRGIVVASFEVVSSHRDAAERFRFLVVFDAVRLVEDLGLDDLTFGATRSGSLAPPVSRFHSSKVSFDILPSTNS